MKLRPYNCKYCNKSFNDPSARGRHQQLHESKNIKSFACNICDKKFTTAFYLKSHEKGHQEEIYQCEQCPSKIKGKGHFREHVKMHSTSLKCSICDRIFKRATDLNLHMKGFHNKGDRMSCSECSSSFKTKGYLYKVEV